MDEEGGHLNTPSYEELGYSRSERIKSESSGNAPLKTKKKLRYHIHPKYHILCSLRSYILCSAFPVTLKISFRTHSFPQEAEYNLLFSTSSMMATMMMMMTTMELHLLGDCGVGVNAANKCDQGGGLTGHIRALANLPLFKQ